LTETTRLDAFLEALDWAVAKIRSHHEALGKREDWVSEERHDAD